MDLWIRSQDRNLLEKAQMIKIAKYHNGSIKEEDFTYSIVVNNDYVFADYKTKERALEVLDLIESEILLQDKPYSGVEDEYNITDNIVYRMPID